MDATENGERLRAWRILAGLSQAAAASRLGITQAAWASWEVGRGGPESANARAVELLTEGLVQATGWPPRRAMRRQVRRSPKAAP